LQKNIYRPLLLLITISLLLVIASSPWALAQGENEPTGFNNVHLWIYPEYDDSRLLVMLEGQIAGAQAPATVRFLVPSTVEMYSAGSMDAQGYYSDGPPPREPSLIPGWDEISFDLTTDTFRVEYYDPIIIGLPDKPIAYEFRRLYPISSLHVVIQEPKQSSNFSVSPEGALSSGSQGFANHNYEYHDIDDGPRISFNISYTKSDALPSLSMGDDAPTPVALIVATIIGTFLVFGAGFYWVRKSRLRSASVPISAREKRPPRRFCSQCGQSPDDSSRFCRYCGTELT
jgi:hypothetical protein